MSSLSPIGTPFIELPTVESTNNYAMGLVRAGMAQHGAAVFTHEQTRGKGQRSRQWASQKDMNIALSAIIQPRFLLPSELFLLSKTIAVAAANFSILYAGEDIRIKWPNDIYWNDRKAAGILIENLWQGGEWSFAIAGIGVNVNQTDFGELAGRAVSLRQITGRQLVPVALARELCEEIERALQILMRSPAVIVEAYRKQLYKLEETVRLKKDNRVFDAIVKDVNANGQLVVQHAIEERFDVGEVEWII